MKRIAVPHISTFSELSIEQVNAAIDEIGARLSIDELNWQQQYPYMPLTTVYLAHDSKSLFVKWHVNGIMLKGVYTKDLQPVHEDSCVEFFCMMPDKQHYINFEFNCLATCSASRRLSKTEDVRKLREDELHSILRYSSLGRRPFCEINGQFTWDVCVAIPLTLLLDLPDDAQEQAKAMIEKDGGYLTSANFYKCADDTSARHYVSWNPIKTDKPSFHCPEQFGELRIEN